MTDVAVRTDNLTRDFGGIRAVDHLALEVPNQTIFGFLGRNGARKTTTIRLLPGLLEPTKGRAQVLVRDTQTHAAEIRCRTGALREDLAALVTREGVTVSLTTHNLAEAEKLCRLVGILRQGQLLAVGSPDALRASWGTLRVEILGRGFSEKVLAALSGWPGVVTVKQRDGRLVLNLRAAMDTAPLVNLVADSGARVAEVRQSNGSLEDAFLTLMEEGA